MNSMWWFAGAIVLGIVEIFTLDLTLIMLAGGAIAGGVAVLLGANVIVAAIVAGVAAALLLFTLRPFLLRSLRKRVTLEETNTAALIGREAKTLTEVTEDAGRAKLNGEVWSARTENDAPSIAEGTEVLVVKISGAIAVVAPK